jgi:hypothetical protein
LHDPAHRDPRGYIMSADQADFPTATKFVNALLKNGVTVHKATAAFEVAGKKYPAGSYVVKSAQAFRPHVLDMFEPQDHPNDFKYPGAPPTRPYDITGWTLALQMGIQFDRELEAFDGPFAKIPGPIDPPAGAFQNVPNATGYLISHKENDSYILVNRLLKAKCDVYWSGKDEIWVAASPAARTILETGAKQLGVAVQAAAKMPSDKAMKLSPVRVGLYDQYGGIAPSGWTRFLLEQFEFPVEVVYPETLDAGNLRSRFDVLLFTDGAFSTGGGRGGGGGGRGGGAVDPETVPAEYRERLGRITAEKTIPELKKFVEAGGEAITIGSSTSIASLLGVPVTSSLTEGGKPLSSEKFYIPGSLMKATIDTNNPLAYGMPDHVDVFFDNSPAFKLGGGTVTSVAKYDGKETLDSGWAWGQQYLDGGVAIADAKVGEGKVVLLGPEVAFRAQPHGTFKFLFNAIYYGSAKSTQP